MKDDSNTSHTNNADHGPDSASMATPNSETSISGTARQGTQQRQGEATGPSTSTRTRATTIGGLKGSAEEADANGATRSCSGVTTTEASAAPNTCTATQPGLKLSEEGKAAEQTASANPGVATTNNDSALMVLTDMEARPSNTQQSGLLSFFPKEKQGENKGNLDKSTEKQAAANSKIPANDHNQNDQATINSAYIALSAVMPAAQVENRQSSAQLSFLPKKSSKPSGSLAPMMTGPAAKSRLEEADQTMPTINPSTNVTVSHPLLNQQQHPEPSLPGAYRNTPGNSMRQTEMLNYDIFSAAGSGAPLPTPSQPSLQAIDSNSQMPQANPVIDDQNDVTDMMHANPVDSEAAEEREKKRQRQQKLCILASIFLFIVAAIIIGVVVTTQKQKEPVLIVLQSTGSPTAYGSVDPSEVPSFAPTGALDLLLEDLPDYTLASMNNGSETPQWKAWNWLANHQNISFLPEWRKVQLFALATFFYAFEGENWWQPVRERWMDDTVEECEWFSSGLGYFGLLGGKNKFVEWSETSRHFLDPCNEQGQLVSLSVEDLELDGYSPFLPPEITLLTSLLFLQLGRNDISAPLSSLLPSELYQMTHLDSLFYHLNDLTGTIPSELVLLSGLQTIDLTNNQLTGQIPSEFGQLTSFEMIRLEKNPLTGQSPSELGCLTALNLLRLGNNQLSGKIPSELGRLTALNLLRLAFNQLTGKIPTELGHLTALDSIQLGYNRLSGKIPSELVRLSGLTGLTELWLDRNQLSGEIPSEIGRHTALSLLYLSNNEFSGEIPSEIGHLPGLTKLELQENQLSGRIPSQLAQHAALTALNLNANLLSGQIPSQFGQLSSLKRSWLAENQLLGQVPSELGLLQTLTSLELYANGLTGQIPSEIGLLTRLIDIAASKNQLSGSIPSELAQLSALVRLSLDQNELTGVVPLVFVGELTSLRFLNLTNNHGLSGTISDDLCFLQHESCTYWGPRPCLLGFDCGPMLCGCDCVCSNNASLV